MSINFKRIISVLIPLLFLISLGLGIYFYLLRTQYLPRTQPKELTHGLCLSDDEYADYPIDEKYAEQVKIPKIPLVIYVKDKKTNQVKFNFQILDIDPKHYHPVELYKCGVYVVRKFNYDPEKTKQDPGFKAEIWKYQYNGSGNSLILLAEKDQDGIFRSVFSYDFRVDPLENYLVLEQSYLGDPNYALVIKDLKTKKDIFVLTLNEILEKYPNIQPGNFNLGVWAPDGKYLWGVIYIGAYDSAYYRIDIETWKADIFPSPSDLPSGAERDFSFKGYLAYVDITSFTGLEGVTEQIEEEARKAGKMKNLWIYNLFTKEKLKIATADPSWRFKPKWISDTELEYELPTGEKKIYKISL